MQINSIEHQIQMIPKTLKIPKAPEESTGSNDTADSDLSMSHHSRTPRGQGTARPMMLKIYMDTEAVSDSDDLLGSEHSFQL